MSYLQTEPDQDDPDVARQYAAEEARLGYVPNYARVFALRPRVLDAWAALNGAVKATMDLRRYELATLAAARRIRSTYCALAHGTFLRDRYYDPATLERIAVDHRDAGLDDVDVAVMDFADRVAGDPTTVDAADVERLRGLGLTDQEILDVALTAAARRFFSTVLDAMGAEADPAYAETLEPSLRQALTVGRPYRLP
jgi:uncharacterized peroxidase-related enzyme